MISGLHFDQFFVMLHAFNIYIIFMKHNKRQYLIYIFLILIVPLSIIGLSSCTTKPPNNIENICKIFKQYPKWYWTAQKVQKKWVVPMSVLMAIMYQESRFRADAKPPRRKLLWIIPWFRPTSAYGYSQAVNATWAHYKRDTGHNGADRDAFADAANFIGWYATQARRRVGISRANAYQLYLIYHEGIGGYAKRTYRKKRWLINVAKKVQRRAWVYHKQLQRCKSSLPKDHWWRFW